MRLVLAILLAFGCGKSASDELKEEIAKEEARAPAVKPDEPAKPRDLPASTKKEAPPPDPEPTTPAEIDTARKKAMIEGRDKDVIRFCEMGKIDENSDPQAALGCTLAACRILETDKARAWAKGLVKNKKDKPLHEQAVKTCLANKVAL